MMTESLDKPALLTAATLCQAALHSSEVGEGRLKEPMPIPHPRQGITCGAPEWVIMAVAACAKTPSRRPRWAHSSGECSPGTPTESPTAAASATEHGGLP